MTHERGNAGHSLGAWYLPPHSKPTTVQQGILMKLFLSVLVSTALLMGCGSDTPDTDAGTTDAGPTDATTDGQSIRAEWMHRLRPRRQWRKLSTPSKTESSFLRITQKPIGSISPPF